MTLEVIGAGWGRTGTESLKQALEILGFGKCHHMFEALMSPHADEFDVWTQVEGGDTSGLARVLEGFSSAVDFPAAKSYRQLLAAYPDAKVVLTVRDANQWYESARATILRAIPGPVITAFGVGGRLWWPLKRFADAQRWAASSLRGPDGLFRGKSDNRAFMVQAFIDWNGEVRRVVPSDQLLVYEVRDGWGPLCAFLGVEIPPQPFPSGNARGSFDKDLIRRLLGRQR